MRATRPGRNEYEIEAELLYEFRRRGAQYPAYWPIVAGGANACILHYRRQQTRGSPTETFAHRPQAASWTDTPRM